MKLNIDISISNLFKFNAPSVLTMILISFYTIVDGIFVARFVGSDALSAINIILPMLYTFHGIAIMIRNGGGAFIGKALGEENKKLANESFSMLIYVQIIASVILYIITMIFLDEILSLLGANENNVKFAKEYISYYLIFLPFFFFKFFFQTFLIMDGKQKFALILFSLGGCMNIILDYILIKTCSLGIKGAALATGISFTITTSISLLYFLKSKKRTLSIGKFSFNYKNLLQICGNGVSEMITSISLAFTTFLYNIFLMKYIGVNGVTAITVVMYLEYILVSMYLGYFNSASSLISFNYGKKDYKKLQGIFKYSCYLICILAVLGFIVSFFCSEILTSLFIKDNLEVMNLTDHAFKLFSFSFLFIGFNIANSAFFTALSNGKVSAISSFLRLFLFLSANLYFLPKIIGADGIWLAKPIAELMSFAVSVYFIISNNKRYKYFK